MKGRGIKNGIRGQVIVDYCTAVIAWASFFTFRKLWIEGVPGIDFPQFFHDPRFYQGVLIIPFGWMLAYFLTGTYTSVYLKSRINEITKTFFVTLAGVIIIFFTVLIDDQVRDYRGYYEAVTLLFFIHFTLTTLGRLVILNSAKNRLERGAVGFSTLFVGGNKRALEVYQELNGKAKSQGYRFSGYVDTNGNGNHTNGNGNGLSHHLPKLGKMTDLELVIHDHAVDQVIVAIESSEHHQLKEILNHLADRNVIIKIVPDMYDILSGSVKMHHLLGASFIEMYPELMSKWQYIMKRIVDIVASIFVLTVFSPLYLFVALKVKLSSPGPVIYLQERVGLHGKPFRIYKFRSMFMNAETNGPLLSSHDDNRITPWGKVMRKWRLDELPQFFNVLKGEMSVVGPRPERKYYIEQILQITTDYKHLHRVQPGITSLGMVKYGYAENVPQMISRMKYDLLYIENMSLILDLKVMLYTLRTIMQGMGK